MEGISSTGKAILCITVLFAGRVSGQSLFLGGGYLLGNRAAGMSAYVADADFAHAVTLNPAELAYAGTIYVASDYENFSRNVGELFLPSGSSYYLSNGNLTAWDASFAMPVGPLGAGAAFSAFDLGGWRTTISAVGAACRIPYGFSLGVTGKYVDMAKENIVPGGFRRYTLSRLTFDIGAMNRTVLANTTFFRAIFSSGVVFTNVLPGAIWNEQGASPVTPRSVAVDLPQTFECGIAYTFASNYRLSDFELFRVTGAIDYAHLLSNSMPVDNFTLYRDQYRIGLDAVALGVLAVRIGYILKTPLTTGEDLFNQLSIAHMGSGFSYGFSLRFPVKLVLPALPVTSLELSYAKNPEWNTAMYHDLFGVTFEMLF